MGREAMRTEIPRRRAAFARRRVLALAVAIPVALLLQACGASTPQVAKQPFVQTPQPTPATTSKPEAVVPASLISDCVQFVNFGVAANDPQANQLWFAAKGDPSALNQVCRDMGTADPLTLQAISDKWHSVQTYIAAAAAAKPTTIPTTQYVPPPAPVAAVPAPAPAPNPVSAPAPQPAQPPAGATALCNDGTYSFSQHRSGTCSHHGGVAVWL